MTEAARDPGPVPELAWLPVDKIQVDHSYQRAINSRRSQALIERIAADFQWCAFQAILACVADGGGWLVLDGQHRCEAAKRAGIAHVPAVVVAAGNVAQQALAFVRANLDRVALNQYALFHAQLAAEDAHAIAVKRAADAAGIEIPRYPIPLINLKPGQTMALGGISRLVRERGEDFALELLTVIAKACAGTRGTIKASLLKASTRAVGDDRSRIADLGAVLSSTTIEKFFAYCTAKRAQDGTGEAQAIEHELRARIAARRRSTSAPTITHTPQRAAGASTPTGQATMAKPGNSNRAEAGRGDSARPSAVRPAAVSKPVPVRPAPAAAPAKPSADRSAELAAQEAFIQNKGVGRVGGAVESVYTPEQAFAALERMGIKYSRTKLSITIHGKAIPHGQLLGVVNRLLVERQMVRVKPGEKVPA